MSLRPVTDAGLIAQIEAGSNLAIQARQISGKPGVYLRATSGSGQWYELRSPFYTANPATGAVNIQQGGTTA